MSNQLANAISEFRNVTNEQLIYYEIFSQNTNQFGLLDKYSKFTFKAPDIMTCMHGKKVFFLNARTDVIYER